MKVRYQYRIYPTPSQKTNLAKLFGCVRVVWNDALSYCTRQYRLGNNKPKAAELQKIFISQAKKTPERKWLKEVSSVALQQSIRDLEQAYQNFFNSCSGNRKGQPVYPPKFKKRKNRQSARFHKDGFNINQRTVYLAKVGKVKTVWSRPLPSEPSSVTVVKDPADRYFVSFVVDLNPEPLELNGRSVGVDLGVSTFATLSTGEKIDAPKPLRRKINRLKKLDKQLSRKTKGSNRYERARKRRAKLYAKLADTRQDFLHKLSTRLFRENQTVVLEDLNVSGMVKNRKLSRAISDLGWRQFRSLCEWKAAKFGREFQIINRWEPSSQKCSSCGFKGGKLDLSVRRWKCANCGISNDRDINAAKNIVAGGQSETLNGRGDCVRLPQKGATINEASTLQNSSASAGG